jgi:pimeloyl-ACP methyl ester carboxylesterase
MSYPLMAEDLAEFIDVHELAAPDVLGHSMGGKTAMQLALLHPERIRRLVVVDIAPRGYPPRHRQLLEAMLALDPAACESRAQMEERLGPSVPVLATRRFLLKNVVRAGPGESFRWRFGLREIAANYARLGGAVESSAPFGGEALFIRGEHSDFLREDDWPGIRALFPGAVLRAIPRSGHLPHTENPTSFCEEVVTFLRPERRAR